MKKYSIKKQRGAISLFVLLSMMFFLTFMLGAFTLVNRRNAMQAETLEETQKIYSSKPSAADQYDEIFSSESSYVPITNFEQLKKVKTVYDNNSEEKYLIDGKVYTYKRTANYLLKNNITIKKEDYEDDQDNLRSLYETYVLNASDYNINLNGHIFLYERHNNTIGKLEKFIYSDAREIAADNRNIGKTVNYGEAYTGSDLGWEILYADSNNVYIITKGYLTSDNLSASVVQNSGYSGTSDFTNLNTTKYPAVADGWLNKVYNNGSVVYSSGNPNMKATEYLLDSTNAKWAGLKNNKAKWVIGAPTLELLVSSYNEVNTNVSVTINDLETSSNGYESTLGSGTLPKTNTSGVDYNPWNHNSTYWLASPSSYGDGYVQIVDSEELSVGSCNYDNSVAIRPVVCLKSEVVLEWNQITEQFDLDSDNI